VSTLESRNTDTSLPEKMFHQVVEEEPTVNVSVFVHCYVQLFHGHKMGIFLQNM